MSDKLDLVKMSIDPSRYECLPPNVMSRTTFVKRFTVNGVWTVDDSAMRLPSGAVGMSIDNITTKTGLVIWFPWRGLNSIYRFGFVPAGHNKTVVVAQGSAVPANPLPQLTLNFTFKHETPLMYQSGDGQIRVSPDASKDFSVTRLVAGAITLVSNAFTIGGTVLVGTLAAGVPNDTRDLAQKAGQSFTPDELVQQSVTRQDSFLNHDIASGAVMLLGSDIPINFSVPNRDNVSGEMGGTEAIVHYAYAIDGSTGYPVHTDYVLRAHAQGSFTVLGSDSLTITQAFFSPFGVEYTFPTGTEPWAMPSDGSGIKCANYKLDPINLLGSVSYDVNMRFYFSATTMNWDTTQTIFRLHAQEIYGQLTPTGNNIDLVAQIPVMYTQVVSITSNTDLLQMVNLRFSHKSLNDGSHIAGTSRGMYLGTLFTLSVQSPSTFATGTTPDSTTVAVCGISVLARANNVYGEGELGPVRVLRLDGVAEGQQIKLQGDLIAECVPEGQVAPYVSSSDRINVKTISVNMYPFLASLYNGLTPLHRIYTLNDYSQLVRTIIPTLTMDTLLQWTNSTYGEAGMQQVVEAAHAGGFWDDLRDGVTGAISTVGGAMQSALPYVPMVLGAFAGGEFGEGGYGGQAAGQYGGHAAGQYGGHAGGQYGGKRARF